MQSAATTFRKNLDYTSAVRNATYEKITKLIKIVGMHFRHKFTFSGRIYMTNTGQISAPLLLIYSEQFLIVSPVAVALCFGVTYLVRKIPKTDRVL
ncbi:MAG: hypothetical protein GX799_11135 [Crenarchaeota archaeon]|nr:hypothetical protein [Thermoproteota archaeon]